MASMGGDLKRIRRIESFPTHVSSFESSTDELLDGPIHTQGRRRIYRIASFVISSLLSFQRPAHAVATAQAPPVLNIRSLSYAFGLLIVSGTVGLWNVPTLLKSLLQGASRCALQLYLVGSLLLTRVLMKDTTPWFLVLGWIGITLGIASKQAATRIDYTYPGMYAHLGGALLGSLSVALGAAVAILRPTPWYAPRTLIPVAGMLIGNALTATTLAVSSITKSLTQAPSNIECRLARGATWKQALQPLQKTTLSTALTPTLNALAATGIVHVPGMMTGQILAGQPPAQAAAYQIFIFLLIGSMSTLSTCAVWTLSVRKLMDRTYHRLHVQDVGQDHKDLSLWERIFGKRFCASTEPTSTTQVVNLGSSPQPIAPPVHLFDDVYIPRTDMKLSAFNLHLGERVALQGPSGVGKSLALQSLMGLESLGYNAKSRDWPTVRRKVAYVSQGANSYPTEGTPREWAMETAVLSSAADSDLETIVQQAIEHGNKWCLQKRIWDQPWSSLSGGEAQRASLAIVLALKPQVLLLDEPTSALDDTTTRLVEQTLKELKLPVLLVSHSVDQVERFCDRVVNLDSVPVNL